MNKAINMFVLSNDSMQTISAKLESFDKKGVKASSEHSGEMNFNGCAKGYCQAWD
ncbi:MAG: hypothetical protein J6C82_06365 [Clostridia bacterium]|nr:hypothetical protein [Clostridia bacterium]MBP3359885.1 hypothetical protein [Clostridia bacterium]